MRVPGRPAAEFANAVCVGPRIPAYDGEMTSPAVPDPDREVGSGSESAASSSAPPAPLGRGAELLLRTLAGGFYVTLWSFVVALAFTAAWFVYEQSGGLGPMPGWAVSAWCAFTALFLVVSQFGGRPRRAAGRPLERGAAPELFQMLDEVGEQLGVGTISAVRLKPAPMMAAARVLRPGRFIVTERRALVIGVPLLRALSVEELRAAVAHELAHLAGGDVRRGRIVNKASRRIALMRRALERGRGPARVLLTWGNPVWWYLAAYGAVLRRGAAAIRRRQESRADALAAGVVGADLYARTLLRVATVSLSFRRLAPGLLLRASEAGHTIDNFFADFARALAELSPTNRRRVERDAIAAQDGEALDHPPLRERLADLGVRGVPSSDADVAPGGDGSESGSERAEDGRTSTCAALIPGLEDVEREMTPLVVRGLMLGLAGELQRRRERRARAAAPD